MPLYIWSCTPPASSACRDSKALLQGSELGRLSMSVYEEWHAGMPLLLLSNTSACDAGQALTVLSRPVEAPSVQDIMALLVAVGEGQKEGLASWHRLVGFNQEGKAEWEVLGSRRAATLQKRLSQFARLACCAYLCPHMNAPNDWSHDGMLDDESEGPQEGLVLLDARGGPVSVLEQSWKEMMQYKLNQ